jgi:hypothetical protein
MRSLLFILFFVSPVLASDNQQIVFFEENIRPVLSQQCYSCHSSKIEDIKGGLSLDSKEGVLKGGDSGPIIVSGDPDQSLLIKALEHSDLQMPPDKKLSNNIIDNFKTWIKNGAIDPRNSTNQIETAKSYWSYRPIESSSSSIDDIILKKLNEKNIKPVELADDYTLLRRVYYDIIGLPPSPDEINIYVNDKNPDKYKSLIEKLLSDKRFGEKWARHWLDVARYADSTGKDQNIVYQYAWRYRDYVIDSFNEDKPYSNFIIEQIAGDLISHKNADEHNKHLIATGFLAIGTKNLTENPKQYKADLIDEQIDAVTRGFLGITLSCARCHDHKFDPFTQKDYYALYGIFQNTITLDGVEHGNNNIGYDGNFGYMRDDLSESLYSQPELWNLISDIRNIHRKIGTIRSYNPNLNDNDKKQVNGELEKLDKEMSEKFQKIYDSNNTDLLFKLLFKPNPIMCVKDAGLLSNAKIMLRGNVNQLGEEVPRSLPVIFQQNNLNPNSPNTSGRIELASWIADKNNPLTHRVYVNRIWKILFDSGIVDSFDNFGTLGGEPKNSELIDYLAKKFIQYNFSTKQIIKEIMLSDTYKRSSSFNQENYEKDADNSYFWRMNEKRLHAELIRDTLLYLSNELDSSSKNHAWTLNNDKRRPDGKINNELNISKHRSIYLPTPRDFDIESLDIFDRPDNNLLSAERSTTTVPTQALYLMNNNKILSHCDSVAKQLLITHKDKSDEEKITYLYLKYLNRNPNTEELNSIKEYIEISDKNKIYTNLVHILVLTGEFRVSK